MVNWNNFSIRILEKMRTVMFLQTKESAKTRKRDTSSLRIKGS